MIYSRSDLKETFVAGLERLQRKACQIVAPAGSGIVSARGGLRGPAFFPEGLGLSASALTTGGAAEYMVIGHNFGCVSYRDLIDPAGREDDKRTWANLDQLLTQSGVDASSVFRTNWFVGLIEEDRQTGRFLRRPAPDYELKCRGVLMEQIRFVRPRAILLLGIEVASRMHEIALALTLWKGAQRWSDVDLSPIGHSVQQVEIRGCGISVNIGALLHPSFGPANQSRRLIEASAPEPVRWDTRLFTR